MYEKGEWVCYTSVFCVCLYLSSFLIGILLGVHTTTTSHDKAPLRLPQIYDIYDQSNSICVG